MTEDPNMEFSDREAENFGPNGYDRTTPNEPLDVGDDIASIPPRGWLVGNTFCRRFISGLVAQGGGAKTTVRLLQALSLASGQRLSGEHVFHQGRVLLVCL